MSSHLDHLKEHVPDIESKRVLDLGSGKGSFLIDLIQRGGQAVGLEVSTGYIAETKKRAQEANVAVYVVQGVGEELPFENDQFDFINMSEVIEHVNDPKKVMGEVARVLSRGGKVYLSVPSRFSIKDPHFHLYFVNWLPRSWSDAFISLFGKHKDYSGDTGKQRLRELHYYTDNQIRKLLITAGFKVEDIRKIKIKKRFKNPTVQLMARIAYGLGAPILFKTYHYLLTKR